MPVLVMDIRIMRMTVGERHVGMLMGVRFAAVPLEIVRVLVVLVMHVAMRVGDWLMGVQMVVTFGQVQPHARTHQ